MRRLQLTPLIILSNFLSNNARIVCKLVGEICTLFFRLTCSIARVGGAGECLHTHMIHTPGLLKCSFCFPTLQEIIKKQNYFYYPKTMFNKSLIEIKCKYTLHVMSHHSTHFSCNHLQDFLPIFLFQMKPLFTHITLKMFFNVLRFLGLREECNPPVNLTISWYLRSCRCFEEAFGIDVSMLLY